MSTNVKNRGGPTGPQLNDRVVEEIRVWMTRRHLNQVTIAGVLDVSQVWVSRRLGATRDVTLSLAEVERFADALDVPVDDLVGTATRQYSDVLAAA